MPDFRYRQTTATLDVRGFPFRAAGRQPIDLGWRAAFPEWQPADEKGDEAQLLPALRNGETTKLESAYANSIVSGFGVASDDVRQASVIKTLCSPIIVDRIVRFSAGRTRRVPTVFFRGQLLELARLASSRVETAIPDEPAVPCGSWSWLKPARWCRPRANARPPGHARGAGRAPNWRASRCRSRSLHARGRALAMAWAGVPCGSFGANEQQIGDR
jgi:hypothetical protein